MSGNRKKVRLASLEPQLKQQPTKPTQSTYAWHEIQIQSQPLESTPYGTQSTSGDFQTSISAAANDSGTISSQSMLYEPFSFDISSIPNPDPSTDLAQSLPTSNTFMTLTLNPFESH